MCMCGESFPRNFTIVSSFVHLSNYDFHGFLENVFDLFFVFLVDAKRPQNMMMGIVTHGIYRQRKKLKFIEYIHSCLRHHLSSSIHIEYWCVHRLRTNVLERFVSRTGSVCMRIRVCTNIQRLCIGEVYATAYITRRAAFNQQRKLWRLLWSWRTFVQTLLVSFC